MTDSQDIREVHQALIFSEIHVLVHLNTSENEYQDITMGIRISDLTRETYLERLGLNAGPDRIFGITQWEMPMSLYELLTAIQMLWPRVPVYVWLKPERHSDPGGGGSLMMKVFYEGSGLVPIRG